MRFESPCSGRNRLGEGERPKRAKALLFGIVVKIRQYDDFALRVFPKGLNVVFPRRAVPLHVNNYLVIVRDVEGGARIFHHELTIVGTALAAGNRADELDRGRLSFRRSTAWNWRSGLRMSGWRKGNRQ